MFIRSGLGFVEILADDCEDIAHAETCSEQFRDCFYNSMAYLRTVRDLMLAGFCMLIFALPVSGQDASWNEVQWSKHLAESIHAEAEYRLQDGSRIDIFQPGVCAWEVEWCSKWEESFGQAAFYAASTDTTPGIWLLKRGKEDDEDYLRFLTTLHFYRAQGVKIKWQVTEVRR